MSLEPTVNFFTPKPHFCFALIILLDRHMTHNRVSLLDVGTIIVLPWLFLGHASDQERTLGENL